MDKHVLAHNGQALWRIVMPHPAHETVKLAAHELQHFLMEISSAALPTQTELQIAGDYEILVGRSGRLKHYGIQVDWEKLGEEGYVIKSGEKWILLAGATPRGTLYAVYAFLEEIMGCRWLSSDCSVIPKQLHLEVGDLDITDRPAFESREAYWSDAFDGTYAVRNRMNSNKADISIRQGGRMKFYNFHHSFDDLVPVAKYFDTHPEYFSMIDGKRVGGRTQLCLTNPEVVKLATEKVKEWIKENPDCRVFSVAQNDWRNYCQCPNCREIDEKEGTPAGTMLHFVNQIAEAIHEEHPDILLHTFAYQYTRKAPKFIRPHPNVIVRLCSIECCFSHTLEGEAFGALDSRANSHPWGPQCSQEGETLFMRDLREWSQICDRLYIWDYVTMFGHYLMPFTNFDVMQKNMQLFKRLGVAGVLEQGNFSQGGGGHLAELEAYLQAKLMWNPDCDMEMHLQDFLHGYYGEAAAPLIREYIELWQAAARSWHISIHESPMSAFVQDDVLQKAMELLGRAQWLTEDELCYKRIHKLVLSMEYLVLARMSVNTPGRSALVERFNWELREAGITELHERWTLDEAIQRLHRCDAHENPPRLCVNDYKM
ncbi:MAG: DUF4838 domain-containing protein [Clostridiales bacterium]|nr:DUF4838 domain-containing protein [Clostridiales bacterium]